MAINIPNLDDRDYQQIVQEAIARIPVHNPEWTNFNDSDPGITLLQLFAFMTESILYRANQVPERNRLKFLQMLGINPAPAAAAQGFVTINNERAPLQTLTLKDPIDVRAGQVRFLTDQAGLDVLPITAQLFYKKAIAPDSEQAALYRQLYADLLGDGLPAFYETLPMPLPQADGTLPVLDLANTVDNCLWIALLTRPGTDRDDTIAQIKKRTLTLGIMPYRDGEGIRLAPGQTQRSEAISPVTWEIADATTAAPNYTPLSPSRTEGSVLYTPSIVELELPDTFTRWDFSTLEPGLEGTQNYPPSLADTQLGNEERDRLITWIRLRLNKSDSDQANSSVKAQLSWVSVNATKVRQEIAIAGEVVGRGTGEPDQSFRLAHSPVIPDTLVLTVDDQPWQQIDDLLAAPSEVAGQSSRLLFQPKEQIQPVKRLGTSPENKQFRALPKLTSNVFALDASTGEITFGDGAHGMRPGRQSTIVASYSFGGGDQGNVGIGSINRSPQLPAGYKVNNPIRTWGGDNAQSTGNAEKAIAQQVQHRDRLVSVADFEAVTLQTPGVDLGRVAILPLFDPTPPTNNNTPGAITVMVIPNPAENQGLTSQNPQPDAFFLEAVCRHLQPRRLVTTELYVRGPKYIDIWVSVGVDLLGGYSAGPVREAVKTALTRFLSPLEGGPEGQGWPLTVAIVQAELEAVVARVPGVRLVSDPLLLGNTAGALSSPARVELSGLELPRLVGISVVNGPAQSIEQLQRSDQALPTDAAWTPIPVIPERC